MKLKRQLYPVLVALTHVPELLAVDHTDSGIRFGSSVTLATVDAVLKEAVKKLPGGCAVGNLQPDGCAVGELQSGG